MKKTIFYSWQSDLPNNTNRGFILDCLERSVKKTSADDLAIEYDVDRDTLDETGTPDIVSTIFLKIQNANVFLADVSIVTGGSGRRLSPNPNVLVELGFAASELSWDNIICVFNQGFGKIEDLPFDLRSRRILTYQLDENPTDKSDVRKELVSKLSSAIKDIHNDLPRLTRRLSQLFTAINPIIIQAISEGHRKFSVNLNFRGWATGRLQHYSIGNDCRNDQITKCCTRSRGSRGFHSLACLPRPGEHRRYPTHYPKEPVA